MVLVFGREGGIVFLGISHPFLSQLLTGEKQNTHVVLRTATGRGKESLQVGVDVRMLQCSEDHPQCHSAQNQQLTAINQSKEH